LGLQKTGTARANTKQIYLHGHSFHPIRRELPPNCNQLTAALRQSLSLTFVSKTDIPLHTNILAVHVVVTCANSLPLSEPCILPARCLSLFHMITVRNADFLVFTVR